MESLSLPDVHINFWLYTKNTFMNETCKNTSGWNPSNLGDLVSLNWERNPNCDDYPFVMGFACVCVCVYVLLMTGKKIEQWWSRRNNWYRIQWLDWNSKMVSNIHSKNQLSCNDVTVWWVLSCTGFYTSAVLSHLRNHLTHCILSKLPTAS